LQSPVIRTFWILVGTSSSFLLSIASAAILSRYFDKIDYGTYKQIIFIYGSLLVAFSAGIPSIFSYFLPRFSLSESKYIAKKLTLILFALGCFFSLFLLVFADALAILMANPQLGKMLKIFWLVPIFLLPTLGLEGIFATYGKTHFVAIYNTISRLFILCCILLPVLFFNKGLEASMYGWVVGSIFACSLALIFMRIPFLGVNPIQINLSYREIFAYSTPLFVASLWGISISFADHFYISRSFGAEIYAEFSNGFMEIPFVLMLTSATGMVLLPIYSQMSVKNADIDNFVAIWRSVAIKSASIIYPLVIFFLFYADLIVVILYSETYINSALYFQICMMVNFFNIIIFSPLWLALGKTRLYAKLHMIIAILAWTLGYLVVLIFKSPVAIAMLSVTLTITKVIVAFLFTAKFLGTSLRSLMPLKTVMSFALHSFMIMLILNQSLAWMGFTVDYLGSLIIVALAYGVLLVASSFLFDLDYLSALKDLITKLRR
jgi:O-antigen/teichoic acid export membrane protein